MNKIETTYGVPFFLYCEKSRYPFFYTYPGAFKWYQALGASNHPTKPLMIVVKSYCQQRDMQLDTQLPSDMKGLKVCFDKNWPIYCSKESQEEND